MLLRLVWGLLLASAFAQSAEFHYRYWDWGMTPTRDNYQYEVLKTALEKTAATDGDFQLSRVVMSFTLKRSIIEVNLGRFVNVRPGPWLTDDAVSDLEVEENIIIPIPIMRNLLGYRRLIIRKEDVEKFGNIQSKHDLQKIVLGQGRDWLDVKIYRHNNYAVSDDVDMAESLIPMLVKKRFDYIPIGVIEVDNLLSKAPAYADKVSEYNNITIYYPFPVVFYVSKNFPAMADRLERGLKLMEKDGSFQELIGKWFAKEISSLRQEDNRFFILENPYISDMHKTQPILFKSK